MISIDRHKTAILRRRISKPVQLLLEDRLLTEETSFFDYGCGKGEDLSFLKKMKLNVSGFDRYYLPQGNKVKSSIVNLGYVINVIENPEERISVLQSAFDLAEDLLVVSVMIRDAVVQTGEQEFGDGIITSWNTFQRYYTQKEFRTYLESTLNSKITVAGLGVYYIFKNSDWQQKYIQSRVKDSNTNILSEFKSEEHNRILGEWLSTYHELGRLPGKNEFKDYKYILKFYGSFEKAEESIRAELGEETYRENTKKRKEKVIIEICKTITKNNRIPKKKDLSTLTQSDIQIFFSSFQEAIDLGMAELKSLSDLSTVSKYINQSTVGKVLPDDIYIHRDSIEYAPEMLQILTELAKIILPTDINYTLIKIARNSWHVTFLYYPNFMEEAHPSLYHSMKVLLHKNQLGYREYMHSESPPILHRKETFLHSTHPRFEEFSALTVAEEEAGLLSRRDIGTKKKWLDLLFTEGFEVQGHTLIKK